MKRVTVYDYDEFKQIIADHCHVDRCKVDLIIDGMLILKGDFKNFELHVEENSKPDDNPVGSLKTYQIRYIKENDLGREANLLYTNVYSVTPKEAVKRFYENFT